jgi:hypothetical protein
LGAKKYKESEMKTLEQMIDEATSTKEWAKDNSGKLIAPLLREIKKAGYDVCKACEILEIEKDEIDNWVNHIS